MRSITGTLAVLSALFFCAPADAVSPGFFPFQPDEEMLELISQAAALALIHDLALAPDQRAQIKRILAPVRGEIDRLQVEERALRDDRIKPLLLRIIEDLKAGRDPAQTPSEESMEEMTAFRARMAGLFLKTDGAYQAVTAVLTPAQQERLGTFCFQEYMGPMSTRVRPGSRLGMEPEDLIQQIRSASPEEIEAMVVRMERRRGVREGLRVTGRRSPAMDRKIETFAALVRQIHAMPQEEFEARADRLRVELDSLSPPGPGPEGRMGPGRGPRSGGFMGRGFDTKRILFSKAFYESL